MHKFWMNYVYRKYNVYARHLMGNSHPKLASSISHKHDRRSHFVCCGAVGSSLRFYWLYPHKSRYLTKYTADYVWFTNILFTVPSRREGPSIGDVRLDPDLPSPPKRPGDGAKPDHERQGYVEIYFTDGIHAPDWGRICMEPSVTESAFIVVCKQLGYKPMNPDHFGVQLFNQRPVCW